MSRVEYEFFATEDGEPWLAFAYGQLPSQLVATGPMRELIMAEADPWDLDEETLAHVREIMDGEPQHIWIRRNGTTEESSWSFCTAEDEGAVVVTGWKLS